MTHLTQLLALQAPFSGGGGGNSFTVAGTPIQLPNQINTVSNLSGTYGIHIVQLGIDLLIFVAVLLAFVFIFYGGWKWLTSEGDKKKVEEARNTIIYSIIGLIVMSLAFLVISVIGSFFNVKILGAN